MIDDRSASGLRHALRQPLFAITLAAENGAMLLEAGSPEHLARAAAKFAVILEQIELAQALLAGNVGGETATPLDPPPPGGGGAEGVGGGGRRPTLL